MPESEEIMNRKDQINEDTARMWVDIIRKTLRGETINEERAERACGHWHARDARNRTLEQDREEWRAILWILAGVVFFGTLADAIW